MDRYVQALHALIDASEKAPEACSCAKTKAFLLDSFAKALDKNPEDAPESFTCQTLLCDTVPVGVSNRHVHLAQADIETLFGVGYELVAKSELSQPGQFAAEETVTVKGPKSALSKVRILGPARKQTQVELLKGDCIKLGIEPCLRESGDLAASPGVTLTGPRGSVALSEGAIVAQRHIHMTPQDARHFNVSDGDIVCIKLVGSRGGVYDQVLIRVSPNYALDCHVDIEEANGMCIGQNTHAHIVKCS